MLPEQQQRIMGYFIEEAKDHLNTIEQGLLSLQATIEDPEKANEVFRAAHSVKGGAAMLGLESIQKTAHRMEDYFKVLKESPVQVDRTLETMFLRISDGLKDLLEQLEGPFGLTAEKAKEIMTGVDPVFSQLENHLHKLVAQSTPLQPSASLTATSVSSPEVVEASFKREVPTLLRQLLGCFKRPDTSENRCQIKSICGELLAVGEKFELADWCDLIETATIAAANQGNDYRTLAPILIREIKKAQELVLTGRASEVSVSESMQALLPEDILTPEAIAVVPQSEADSARNGDDVAALNGLEHSEQTDSEVSSFKALDEPGELPDLFSSDQGEDQERSTDPGVSEEILGDPFTEDLDNLGDLFGQPTAGPGLFEDDENDENVAKSQSADKNSVGVKDKAIERLSVDLEFDEIPSELSTLNRHVERAEEVDESLDALLATVNVTGPEVGEEELNSLADLFDGDLDELDNTLGGHAFASEEMRLHPERIDEDEEFSALLSGEAHGPSSQEEADWDEDEDLFGGTLNGEAFAIADEIDFPDLDDLSPKAAGNAAPSVAAEERLPEPWDENWNEEASYESPNFRTESSENSTGDAADFSEDLWGEEAVAASPGEGRKEDSTAADFEGFEDFEEFEDLDADSSAEALADLEVPDLEQLYQAELQEGEADSLDLGDFGAEINSTDVPSEAEDSVSGAQSNSQADSYSVAREKVAREKEVAQARRNLEIEFPTLSGVKLKEAEESIDSFFLGTPGEEIAGRDIASDEEESGKLSVDLDVEDLLEASTDAVETASVQLADEPWDELPMDVEPVAQESRLEDTQLEDLFEVDALDQASLVSSSKSGGQESNDDLWREFASPSAIEAAAEADEADILDITEDFVGEQAVEGDTLAPQEENQEIVNLLRDNSAAPIITPLDDEALLDFESAFGSQVGEATTAVEAAAAVGALERDEDEIEQVETEAFSLSVEEDAQEELLADSEDWLAETSTPEPIDDLPTEFEDSDDFDFDFFAGSGPSASEAISNASEDAQEDGLALDFEGLIIEPDDLNRSFEVAESESLAFDFAALAESESAVGASLPDNPQETASENEFEDLDSLLADDDAIGESGEAQGQDAPTLVGPETGSSASEAANKEDFGELERLLEDGEAESPTLTSIQRRSAPRAVRRVGGVREQTMRVSVGHLDNLSNLVGELVVSRNSLERDQERLRQFLDNLLFQVQQLNDVGQRMRDLYERSLLESSLMSSRRPADAPGLAPEPAGVDHATGETFDALEMDRFTGFHSLSQEMIELIVRVRESASDIGYTVESSDQVTRLFRQITMQLQEGLNTARMVPFAQAADRLPRAVRDISLKCGKEARLVVEGQNTLIDKMIVESLYDPLTHLVNNAITHGIESPEARRAGGKPPEGTIMVRAFYQGNQTVIYVADDGGGIDTEVVKRKAVEKKLISAAEAAELSEIDVYELLFHPGFSTRDQADDFAGRGVGMDVVRTSLAEIRGSVTIDSQPGKGTSFTIRLPLTLSISKALSCVSSQARIAFPMDGVEDMLDVPRDRIVKNDKDQDCVRWRDTLLPFQPVTDLLKFNRTLGRSRVYGGNQDDDVLSIIVLRNANTFVAIQVDQVIGEQEIVIKQLEGPVPKPLGIAGATVLGDGRVMPIADVLELIDIALGRIRREPTSMMWAQDEAEIAEEPATKTDPTVLIVDDSITVRELLSMSFNKVGYRVEQARDGQEAWDKLRSGLPCDLVFCDIEMPRMDGLELLSRMQKDSQLKRIPIAMLTSRGADRHRQMAIDLGASGYFTKPYLEEALLDAAQRMLNGETLAKGRGG